MQTTRPEKELLAMTESQPATPTASGSTAITRFNALRHGVLSRYTVLPWEDWEEYQVLLTALVAEHAPRGHSQIYALKRLVNFPSLERSPPRRTFLPPESTRFRHLRLNFARGRLAKKPPTRAGDAGATLYPRT
jgi:hypothetical protein